MCLQECILDRQVRPTPILDTLSARFRSSTFWPGWLTDLLSPTSIEKRRSRPEVATSSNNELPFGTTKRSLIRAPSLEWMCKPRSNGQVGVVGALVSPPWVLKSRTLQWCQSQYARSLCTKELGFPHDQFYVFGRASTEDSKTVHGMDSTHVRCALKVF